MERALREAIPDQEGLASAQPMPEPGPLRPTVGDAIRRYWPLVLVAVMVCGGLAAYGGYTREPVYEATASLSVGLLDLNTQSVPGFAVGGEVVASGYSRSVQSDEVVGPIARRLGLTPAQVRSRVAATTVPNSPIFTVTGAGASAPEAVRLANALSRAMVAYGRARASARASSAPRLLDRYRKAVRDASRLRSRVATLRSRLASGTSGAAASPGASDSPRSSRELAQARAELATQELRAEGIAELYRTGRSQPATSAVVEQLVSATTATSDRRSTIKLYGALGALVGLLLGTALAVLLTGRRYHRSLGS